MTHINEFSNILKHYLKWNKARIDCLSHLIIGIIATKTVNLAQIAVSFKSKAKISSSYRRIQRFFSEFSFDISILPKIAISLFPLPHFLTLVMDRTNWKFGTTHINFLVISIAYKGVSIPIYWINLAKGGASNKNHRMHLLAKVLQNIGAHRIHSLLADREFIGKEWFKWLISCEVNFIIRIRGELLINKIQNDPYSYNAHRLFSKLKPLQKKVLKYPVYMDGIQIYLSASRSPMGELLIVASPNFNRHALYKYQERWQIENLFSCLKTKGFNLEDTHLKDKKRLEQLLFVVVLAFYWSYLIGLEREQSVEIPVKSHGRKSHNIFQYGYEVLRNAFFQGIDLFRQYFRFFIHNSRKMEYG